MEQGKKFPLPPFKIINFAACGDTECGVGMEGGEAETIAVTGEGGDKVSGSSLDARTTTTCSTTVVALLF